MDDELNARLVGIRLVLAAAIKATCRTPADFVQTLAALRAVEDLIPPTAHPAVKEELDTVLATLTHFPVRASVHEEHRRKATPLPVQSREDLPDDLLV